MPEVSMLGSNALLVMQVSSLVMSNISYCNFKSSNCITITNFLCFVLACSLSYWEFVGKLMSL